MKVLQPNQQAILECKVQDKINSFTDLCGVIIPNEVSEKDSEIILTSSLNKVVEYNVFYIYVLNITEHPVTTNKVEEIAKFSYFTSDPAERLLEVDPQLINIAIRSKNYLTETNQLIQVRDSPKKPNYQNLTQNMKNYGSQRLKRARIRQICCPFRAKSLTNC